MKKIFVVIGFALLLFGWYFLFVRDKQIPVELPDGQVETETLEDLGKTLGVTAEIRDSDYVDWTASDGASLPLKSKQIILGTNGTNGIGKYGSFSTTELMRVNPEFLNPLAEKIKKYYFDNGFSESVQNTNSTPNDLWFKNLGFEKDGVYCVSNLAKQSDPFAYLSCGSIDEKQLLYQRELESVYEEEKSQVGSSPVPLIFRVKMVDGDFAIGSSSSIGGWEWIAKKNGGNWKVVWQGQDYPSCGDMKKNGVPKMIYKQCYNPETQNVE